MTVQQTRRVYVKQLASYLGGRYAVTVEQIMSRDRRYVLARCRHLIAYRLYRMHWTVTEIGELLGLDHSTISYALRRIPLVMASDADVVADYDGMPAWGVQTFTEASLVELYRQLTKALAEAKFYGEQIEQQLAAERVPTRTDGVLRALVNAS